ncbi:carboxypeptidase-like regulatory domain-containing protein [Spirosoma utsteinense]|uniref:Carboxypeptidase-like regulatory domain-containing protein n=1 Tax=Spirosoma utsteinense TaxID=2585773 RepID=A0ABR6WDU1_9BACT|nr:carboxypeptidase-like regulatory domain-containing protein [Spirosoma utsteinense]MBC3794663.1 hypothetical protein [Spirosoma utsteinense]
MRFRIGSFNWAFSSQLTGYWVSLLVGLYSPLLAQSTVSGLVLDKASNQPVPYANIGIVGSPIGTLSNANGSFQLLLPAHYLTDSLLISHLGYTPQSIAVRAIKPNLVITLQPEPIQLAAIDVLAHRKSSRKSKRYVLGNKLANSSFIVIDTAQAGSAMALLIENKFPQSSAKLSGPIRIEKAAVQIYSNSFAEFKLRVRLLTRDSLTGLPGRDLLHQSVILTSRRQQGGWLEADLSSFGIHIPEVKFFIVFEWILDARDRRLLADQYQQFALAHPEQVRTDTTLIKGKVVPYTHWRGYQAGTAFSTSTLTYSLNNYQSFCRHNSQGSWQRSPHILSARVFVSPIDSHLVN